MDPRAGCNRLFEPTQRLDFSPRVTPVELDVNSLGCTIEAASCAELVLNALVQTQPVTAGARVTDEQERSGATSHTLPPVDRQFFEKFGYTGEDISCGRPFFFLGWVHLLHTGNMETEGPFVKVPIECVSQVFRKTRKTVSEKDKKTDQRKAARFAGLSC